MNKQEKRIIKGLWIVPYLMFVMVIFMLICFVLFIPISIYWLFSKKSFSEHYDWSHKVVKKAMELVFR